MELIDLLCVGDVAVDIYSNGTYPGGCSLNVIRHLDLLCKGTPSNIGIMAPVGDDDERKIVENSIAKTSIQKHLIMTDHNTSRCHIEVDSNGERHFPKYDATALANYRFDDSLQDIFHHYKNINTLVSAKAEGMFRSFMKLKLQHNIFCDFSDLKDFNSSADIVREFIPNVEIVFCGLEEHQSALIQDLQKLSKEFQKTVVITLGENGSMACQNGMKVKQPTTKVENVLDTTGAGDSFIAAYLKEYLKNAAIEECLKTATLYAVHTIQYEGAFQVG